MQLRILGWISVISISCVAPLATAADMSSDSSSSIWRVASVAATEYRAFANCVRVERKQNGGQNLHNDCDFTIEAYWLDTQGGRNQIRMKAFGQYPDATEVSSSLACRSGDFLDWHSQQCHGYQTPQ
jgi:hypothetical protein